MSKTNPPKRLLNFFRWYCKKDYAEDLEGDLVERFHANLEEKDLKNARWNFAKDVIKLFRPGIIKNPSFIKNMLNYGIMQLNFKLGIRNLIKRKGYTAINISGLALGMASAIMISLYIVNQYSYDKSIKDSERIYKLVQKVSSPEEENTYPRAPYSLTEIMVDDYDEIEAATAISGPYESQVVSIPKENGQSDFFIENSVLIADSNFFSVFNFEMIRGNPEKALSKPNSVVLTESTASRLFGNDDPLGRFIEPSGKPSIVTGVCKDPPHNSHLQFSYIVSSTSVRWFSQEKFNLSSAHCYFKLKNGASVEALESKLPQMMETYVLHEILKSRNVSKEEYLEAGNAVQYLFKPLTGLHLDPDNLGGFQAGGNVTTLRVLMAIAAFILVIAVINFINLSTARATERSREVGLRKTMGSRKAQLIIQFLSESFLINLISIVLAALLVVLLLPYFSELTESSFRAAITLKTVAFILIISLLTGLLAGIYPAFVLSASEPVSALKSNTFSGSKSLLRNGLTTFQFWIATILIVCTLIVHHQVGHMKNKDLGFDKEQLLVIEGLKHREPEVYLPFLNRLGEFPEVKNAGGSNWVQGFSSIWHDLYTTSGLNESINLNRTVIGDHFAEALGLELISGNTFSKDFDDSLSVVLNESAVKVLGLSDPIGQKINLVEDDTYEQTAFTIKGVVKDFHYAPLHEPIEPLVIMSNEQFYGNMRYILARIDAQSDREAIARIESLWKEMIPNRPFRYRFFDDTLEAAYKNEQRTSSIISMFTILTIVIAGIGLFALSSYIISIRVKEIGIRKVLGASINSLIFLLFKNFLQIMVLAFLLAIPFSWYLGNTWLENFAYRIEINPQIFIMSMVAIIVVTGITVSFQAVKAALANPVKSLRSE
ncbi:MAG: ABC transporter permease [Bacteroidota bacterium]